MSATVRTLKLLDMNLAQVGNRRSRSDVPHDVIEGVNV